MQEHHFHLLLHGESTSHPDILDLERHFVRKQLRWVVQKFPELPIVLEHVSTEEGVEFVLQAPAHVTATVTPQHLWFSINSLFEGGLRPHRYCLPLYKHPRDQQALISAVTSGNPKFCAGDDTAPHPKLGLTRMAKLTDCGCAGAYVAPVSVPMYAAAFERAGAMDERFERFMSLNGAQARGLAVNEDDIIIERQAWTVPDEYQFGGSDVVVPLFAGESLAWQVVES
jgi:dihydroorotase